MFPILSQPRDPVVTFAEPGEGRSFTAALLDGFSTDPVKTDVGTMFGFDPGDGPTEQSPWVKVLKAAFRQQSIVDNTYSREQAIEEAADRRIAAVEQATGEKLQNFTRVPPTIPTMAGFDPPQPQGETARDAFHRQLRELQDKHPDLAGVIRADVTIEDDAREAARQAEGEMQQALADPSLSAGGALFGALTGSFAGSFRDPLQVSMLMAGGGPGVAASSLARIGQVAVREGLYNAGAVALTQPAVQAWREEIGVRSGALPAIENVGLAFLLGGIIGGGIQVGREIKGPARKAIERTLDGTAAPNEVVEAARALDLPQQEIGAIEAAFRAAEDEAAVTGKVPQGVEPELHSDLTAAAIRHAEDPVTNPPPAALIAESMQTPEIAARVQEAQPRTLAEARAVAAEAMEDIGNRSTMDRARADLDEPVALRRDAEGAPIREPFEEPTDAPKRAKADPFDKVPALREDGSVALVSRAENAKAGERDNLFADLVRSCK